MHSSSPYQTSARNQIATYFQFGMGRCMYSSSPTLARNQVATYF